MLEGDGIPHLYILSLGPQPVESDFSRLLRQGSVHIDRPVYIVHERHDLGYIIFAVVLEHLKRCEACINFIYTVNCHQLLHVLLGQTVRKLNFNVIEISLIIQAVGSSHQSRRRPADSRKNSYAENDEEHDSKKRHERSLYIAEKFYYLRLLHIITLPNQICRMGAMSVYGHFIHTTVTHMNHTVGHTGDFLIMSYHYESST